MSVPSCSRSYLLFVRALGKGWRERVGDVPEPTLLPLRAHRGQSHPSTKKKEDDVVLLLYVVSLSTDVALQGRYAVGDLSASPMLDHIMLSPNGPPAGTAGN